ncbi:hypothetical protein [Nocardia sp. R7R-8]|uniref:hypothetical protein n=1 Tax=Nocardia sp. R7R-8 TaxID=3459304 RepID=UPI00403DA502
MNRVVNMLVGDTQRVWVYADQGWAIEQDVPSEVQKAYSRLVAAGFTRRLVLGSPLLDDEESIDLGGKSARTI